MVGKPSIKNYIAAFFGHWSQSVSGGAALIATAGALGVGEDQNTRFVLLAAAVIAFVIAAYRVWAFERRRVVELTRNLTPKFALSFEPDHREMPAITAAVVARVDATGHTRTDRLATYARVWVYATSNKVALDCSAAIVWFSVKTEESSAFQSCVLPQMVPIGPQKFDIKPGMPIHLDFLFADNKHNKLRAVPGVPWPLIWEGIFDVMEKMRFEIVVSGGACSERICVEIDWNGSWTSLTGRKVNIS